MGTLLTRMITICSQYAKWLFSVLILAFSIFTFIEFTKQPRVPPKAAKKPLSTTLHNDTRIDNYAWLRDKHWPEIKDKAILAHLNAENAYTASIFRPLNGIQENLYQELRGRIQEEDSTYPINEDGFLYYSRTEKGKNYTIHCRKKINSQKEEVILDENELAKKKGFFNLGAYEFNHNHQLLTYSTDNSGQERYTLRIKDLKTGKLLSDVLENTAAGIIIWHKKVNGFFYIALDEKLRANRVFFHKVGEPQVKDTLIYQEKDETYSSSENSGLRYSSDRHYAFLDFKSSDSWESHYIDLESESLVPQIVIPRMKGKIYKADYLKGNFYILINDTGSNFRLVRSTFDKLFSKEWAELIPHNPATYLVNFYMYQSHLVLKQVENGLPKIKVRSLNNIKKEEEIPLTKEVSYETNVEFTHSADSYLRIKYSSLVTPETIFEYSFATKEIHLRKTQLILGGFNTQDYQVERIKAPSKDGTMIPISLVYKKSLKKDSGNPVLLYGYGAYGIGTEAGFSSKIISLLDRGFIYAISHIRGGNDMGYQWYVDGKMLNKKHTFEDFIACSEYLIKKGYTSKKKIAIDGGSAGGMLMGYCANERPDLYHAVVATAPFVDVLNTMLDGNLPLTPGEYKEWGNPKDEKYYNYIKSYSPYDNIVAQNYPHMYITGGLNDSRVAYWEPAKWAAKLREHKTDHNLLLLDINMGSGHLGASGRYSYLNDEFAKYYAFLLHVFGLKDDNNK